MASLLVRRLSSHYAEDQPPTPPQEPASPRTTFSSLRPKASEPPSSPSLHSFRPSPKPVNPLQHVAQILSIPKNSQQLAQDIAARASNLPTSSELAAAEVEGKKKDWGPEPFHFHVYGHKHNTHITVTKPDRNAIISISTGQIGFKKAKRGTYDAAYQLCAYVMDKLNQGGWHKEITQMEVVLRGFGNGREAATKVLLGTEGKLLRNAIVKVSDATRLKFGGTRSKKPRRLG
ncbi:uncharacterized protein BCR38DRAFT_456734 [Pseudomassariella vexata]|uniref:Small ribosomal subunit protein uS11m n=1 Tax=Pseudomassariella vexata TaxID=1141098 RepID=A0A1Y2E3G4_9PEZI|nr:uncharacterized protein BCR38DRAFT_456734 [Pseudomassariella vexata]ORY66093.1 hypothetical protein BCR38DRAFT_456734 [Pseudomassariella vexata]